MREIEIKNLHSYPLKSANGFSMKQVDVEKTGFYFDRSFAVIDTEYTVITARENSRLLLIQASLENELLMISIPGEKQINVEFGVLNKERSQVILFKTIVQSKVIEHEINIVLSKFLDQQLKLICVDKSKMRVVKEKYNGGFEDEISFNDIAPIHLVNEASVQDLNLKLQKPVLSERFRPNIIITGAPAYAEETWKKIKIGTCEFEVITKTERCSLITIDPETTIKDSKQEPLRTLAQQKRDKKVVFGIYLIPRKLGVIRLEDKVEILE